MPDWFAEAVDLMERPDLPPLDVDAALAATSGSVSQVEAPDPTSRQQTVSRTTSSGERGSAKGTRSPLSDVWDP